MLAASLAFDASRRRGIGQAADSHSCRDQGKTRGGSARDSSPMIQSKDSPGIIPTFSTSRAAQGSAQAQVISLGNIKWTRELLRPISEMSQPETTTTQQQPNTFIPQAGTLAIGINAIEPTRMCSSGSAESSADAAAGGDRAGAGEQLLGIAMESRSPPSSSSSSSPPPPAATAAPSRLSGRQDRNGGKPAAEPPTDNEHEQGEAAAVAAPCSPLAEPTYRPTTAPPSPPRPRYLTVCSSTVFSPFSSSTCRC